MRRIEGFEKRQGAKPKRSLAHPPCLRSCVSGSTHAPGGMSCCAAHCRGYVVRTAMRVVCPVCLCLFVAGVSLRRPRQSCCQAV